MVRSVTTSVMSNRQALRGRVCTRSRKAGVCFSSSAPGFTNLVSPIAQAKSALSPVVLLNGQHGVTGDGVEYDPGGLRR